MMTVSNKIKMWPWSSQGEPLISRPDDVKAAFRGLERLDNMRLATVPRCRAQGVSYEWLFRNKA